LEQQLRRSPARDGSRNLGAQPTGSRRKAGVDQLLFWARHEQGFDNYEQLRRIRRRHDRRDLQFREHFVATLARQNLVQRFGHLATKLQNLAIRFLACSLRPEKLSGVYTVIVGILSTR